MSSRSTSSPPSRRSFPTATTRAPQGLGCWVRNASGLTGDCLLRPGTRRCHDDLPMPSFSVGRSSCSDIDSSKVLPYCAPPELHVAAENLGDQKPRATHPCIHASMHPCINAFMHPCIHASMNPCVHVSMHPCVHVSTRPCRDGTGRRTEGRDGPSGAEGRRDRLFIVALQFGFHQTHLQPNCTSGNGAPRGREA